MPEIIQRTRIKSNEMGKAKIENAKKIGFFFNRRVSMRGNILTGFKKGETIASSRVIPRGSLLSA